jgi:hypothetical protein
MASTSIFIYSFYTPNLDLESLLASDVLDHQFGIRDFLWVFGAATPPQTPIIEPPYRLIGNNRGAPQMWGVK